MDIVERLRGLHRFGSEHFELVYEAADEIETLRARVEELESKWLSPETYETLMGERKETLHELAAVTKERDEYKVKAVIADMPMNQVEAKLKEQLAASQAENARLREDAERYQWLRKTSGSYQGPEVWIDGNYHLGQHMDDAIDAALAGESK